MPTVIALRNLMNPDNPIGDVYFLLKEQNLPIACVELIKSRIIECINSEEKCTKEDIIAIAELTIDEYNGTLIPFTLYKVIY